MVRSKSEDSDPRDLFHLVEKIRSDRKYFAVSCAEIERELLAAGYFDCYGDYECDDGGQTVAMRLRLNITAPSDYMFAWKMAIKLHDTRIDGIDHHEWLPLDDGRRGPGGWHRHHWEPRRKRAGKRVRLEQFGKGLRSLNMFLRKCFDELGVEVNRHDDGSQHLRFD